MDGLPDQDMDGVGIPDTHIEEVPSTVVIVGIVRGWENSAGVAAAACRFGTGSTKYSLLIPLIVISSDACRTGTVVGLAECEAHGDEFIERVGVGAADNGVGDALPYGC